jgi:LacI family gluconate utilization system Gnt-I transcriptional repressor
MPRARRTQPTSHRMEDVARLADVALITVSRVVNQPDKVAPETRRRVERAIRAVGYVPNLVAGSLASSRSRIVAALVPTLDRSVFSDTIRGLSERLASDGYQLLLGSTGFDLQVEEQLVRTCLGRRVDALVLTGVAHTAATRRMVKTAGIPVVETWESGAGGLDMTVGFSNQDAGAAMGEYLMSKGHRVLAFVGGPGPRSEARLKGFERAARRDRRVVVRPLMLPEGSSYAAGRQALDRLLQSRPRPDAIFFSNDAMAVGALMECRRRGIAVPQSLAIAGFANLDIAEEVVPALTTMQVQAASIGTHAAEMILRRLSGEASAPSHLDLGFSIVVRDSA